MSNRLSVKRPPVVLGETTIIPLTKGYECVIDTASLPLVGNWNWSVYGKRNIYAGRGVWVDGKCSPQFMHRELMGNPDGFQVDHINGDTLDNRISNLRLVTGAENAINRKKNKNNSSGHKGVSWNKRLTKWQAQIRFDGERIHLGFYHDLEEAADAYRDASMRLHGKLARGLEHE